MTAEQTYLCEVQYRHPDWLAARALLHTRYGRGDWFEWLAANIPFPAGGVVADVGCGAGAFWADAPPRVPDDLRLRLFDLSALVDRALARAPGRRVAPLTSEAATPLLQAAFGSVERVRFEDTLVVTDPLDVLAYLLSLPVGDDDAARDALAAAVADAFAGSGAAFRITKAADLLLCRGSVTQARAARHERSS